MRDFESSYFYQDARVRVFGHMDTPKRRYPGEDGYLYIPSQGLALLGDGSSSSINARAAVEAGMGSLTQSLWGVWLEQKTYRRILGRSMVDASAEIGKKAPGSWTTMVAARLQVLREGGVEAYVASVGDSRPYLLNPGEKLRQLTRDHNLLWATTAFTDAQKDAMTEKFNSVASEEEYDALSSDERWFYDEANWVTQILGVPNLKYPKSYAYNLKKPRVLQPGMVREKLVKGSKLVIVSDGILVLTSEEIEDITRNSENPAKELVTASIERMTGEGENGVDHFRSGRDDAVALSVEVLQ
jgi:serine/threonine protein phosphatase PrpC